MRHKRRRHSPGATPASTKPLIARALTTDDLDEVVADADVIVLGNADPRFEKLARQVPSGKKVIDLVGFMPQRTNGAAEGICW